ncbi:TraX family protein [Peptoniphilus equinus]|uniref:TraX family protein n=1 Tax=Peptoniphilus equinus TaxID=3016343 RepID=A0ABY7QRF0_9FIRM|nr:TraX family protein [Peptoniphilus equinus]WBW49371.1 TraX family protein [Peptoniphilus equinus]
MQATEKKGINGYQLKLLGAALMVFDHIHQMFYWAGNVTWMHMFGRSVMPIFLFTCAEGFYHTGNRKHYALRLLLGFWFMSIVSPLLMRSLPIDEPQIVLMNNVFGTMFISVAAMWGIEKLKNKEFVKGTIVLVLPILPTFIFNALLNANQIGLALLVQFAVPSYMGVEGGFLMVLLAVWFYLSREKRLRQYLGIIALAALSAFSYPDFTWASLFGGNHQWMMIFSIIPLYFYNGKRGKGSKYFFYIFYPAHIYALYIVAFVLLKTGV